MKPIFRKFISLSLAVLLAAAPLTAQASVALGDDLTAFGFEVNRSTELHRGTFWSNSNSDLREENYVVYSPNRSVKPLVTCGECSTQLLTVSAAARELEAQDYRVVAGINGDYYDTATGVPLGSVMTDGVFRNILNANYAIGFYPDGSAIMGKPDLRINAVTSEHTSFTVAALNYVRSSAYGIYLFDSAFNARHTTGTSEAGVDVICSVESGSLSIGGAMTLRVDEVLPNATDTVVPDGKYILTANLNADPSYVNALLAMMPGELVQLSVEASSNAWNGVTNLIGALYQLVENGQVCPGLITGSAPRTAIGMKADGSIILYTIDGRQSGYSIGASLTQVAERLIELGCVTAMSLDGGGSTTLVTTAPDSTTASVANKPSGGSSRAVTNHIFLVASAEPSGGVSHIYVEPESNYVLPGGQVTISAAALDSNYIPTDKDIKLTADCGEISGNVFTAPNYDAGAVKIRASAGGRSEYATVTVITSPDGIKVYRSGAAVGSLNLSRGDKVSLSASATYRHLPISGSNESFVWSVTGGVGTIDQSGNFVAGNHTAEGSIVVSLGSSSVTVPVTISSDPLQTIDGFEAAFAESYGIGTSFSRCTNDSYVRRGTASAKLSYACDNGVDAQLSFNYAIPSKYDQLNLWVYGDSSYASMTLVTDCGYTDLGTLDFSGWRQLSVKLPSGCGYLYGLLLSSSSPASGTIYLDQLVLSFDGLVDTVAPTISLHYNESAYSISGTVLDDCDAAALSLLRVTYDGSVINRSFSGDGALTISLPASDGAMHRVTVYAADASGNMSRKSFDILPAETTAAFPDTADHWANLYVGYLKRVGVTTGDGNGNFCPDTSISRQEFAVLLYRYLKPTQDFSSVALPFADCNEIGSWALEGVRAMYALGVTKGTVNGMGEPIFSPTSTISRQEAVTMIGRLLEKGYAAPTLTYSDRSSVASWSYEYISVLSNMGILAGDANGRINPGKAISRAQVATILYKLL